MSEANGPDLSAMFTPFALNGVSLRNRFVMPGMQRGWCRDGAPGPELADYYRERADGGVGLIITEACAVDQRSATQGPFYGWIRDDTATAWGKCVAAAHAGGARLFVQLWHEGAIRKEGGDGPHAAHPTISPSGLIHPGVPHGRAATRGELDEIRDAYVRAALTAQAIGADGVEVHAAHGYLLDQFLWAGTNRRDDGYGGDDMRDRVRFPAEVVAAVRDAVGPDFPISLRFSQWKEIDFTARVADTPEELAILVETMRTAGVDLFHVSTRRFFEPEWPDSDLGLAGWVKSMTDAGVCAVGSVGVSHDLMETTEGGIENVAGRLEPGLIELGRRFDRGDFDLVSVGRSNISDAGWVGKVRDRRLHDVRPFRRADLDRPGRDNAPHVAPSFIAARKAEAERDARSQQAEG